MKKFVLNVENIIKLVAMPYILGVYLSNNLNAIYGITKIYGIGFYITKLIFNDLNISYNSRVKDLTQTILVKIFRWIDTNKILIESSLKHKLKKSRLRMFKLYKRLDLIKR